jgi:hypothetical protein
VMYEVKRLDILTSEAYLERLNNPSPWTTKMMPYYQGMTRGFCSMAGTFGFGVGHAGLLIRFKPTTGAESSLRRWLLEDTLPALPSRPGIASAHLFEAALIPKITAEQHIRGADAGFDWGLFLTGYRHEALVSLLQTDLGDTQLEEHGAEGVQNATYRMDYSLTDHEVNAR